MRSEDGYRGQGFEHAYKAHRATNSKFKLETFFKKEIVIIRGGGLVSTKSYVFRYVLALPLGFPETFPQEKLHQNKRLPTFGI